MGNFRWTEEEDAFLREQASSSTCAQLAATLHRSTKAVWNECLKLGIQPVDGRSKKALEIRAGQEFDRLTVIEVGYQGGRRAAKVVCSGTEVNPHEPVEKWVQLFALVSGAVMSCGCRNREVAAERAQQRNVGNTFAAKPPEERRPRYEPTVRVLVDDLGIRQQHRVDENGRECARCSHYKLWAEFSKGNGSRGHGSWCKQCQKEHNDSTDLALRREQALARRLKVFGLTIALFRVMEAVYDGRCWLCREFETLKGPGGIVQRLGVDHDHNCCGFDPTPSRLLCGKCIRGLCCHRCNRQVLGNVESVGAHKVFHYLAEAQAVAQAVIGKPAA